MNHHTETDLLLIRRWLNLLQQHYRIYNIDSSHQCLGGMGMSQTAERSSIVRIFPGRDNFFGCVQCGQYHICQQSHNTCYVVSDHKQQRLFCLFSGQLLENCENIESRPFSMQNDNTVSSLESDEKYFNTGTSFCIYGDQSTLYTNMKKRGGRAWGKREAQTEETEWSHVNKKPRKEDALVVVVEVEEEDKNKKIEKDDEEIHEDGDGDDECEFLREEADEWQTCDESNPLSKKTTCDSNYQYWSNFYSFLYEKRTFPKPEPSIITTTTTTTTTPKHISLQFNYNIGIHGKEIERECNTLLERLLLLSADITEKKEQIFLLLCDYFVPLVKNFYLLVHNSPVIRGVVLDKRLTKAGKEPLVMTPKQVTEAVILHLLLESYQTEDIAKNKIQLWVRNPWIVHLNENGHIAQYYTKYLNKNGNTMERATHTKNDIKECLSFYFIHSHWLQKFIHANHYL